MMKKDDKTPFFIFNYCSVSGGETCAFCLRNGTIEGSYLQDGVMKQLNAEADDAVWSELAAVLERNGISLWKGGKLFRHFAFASSPDTFTLECLLPDGNRYEANAAAGFPNNFTAALQDIRNFFIALT